MDVTTLQWPGLWDLNTFIIDAETKKVYSKTHPLPPLKQHLDTVSNRYVRLSEVLNLFGDGMRDEAEWTLREIQRSYNIGQVVHSTIKMPKSTTDGDRVERKVTTYISTSTLMVFAIVWPYCKPFKTLQNTLLNYLDNYAESVCLDCGYIHRDCLCRLPEAGLCSSSRSGPLTFVGHAYVRKDQSIQTDLPTVLSSNQVKPNSQPGISVLIPPGLQLQPGMRFPVTLAQTPSGNGGVTGQAVNSSMFYADTTTVAASSTGMPFQGVDASCSWGANYITLPTSGQTNSCAQMSFTLGQQNLFNPVLPSGDMSSVDSKLSHCASGRPGSESNILSGQSVLLSSSAPGINFICPPPMSLLSGRLPSDSVDSLSNRKRKFDGERPLEGLADVSVQTTAKSFIKKLKLRLDKINNTDNIAAEKANVSISVANNESASKSVGISSNVVMDTECKLSVSSPSGSQSLSMVVHAPITTDVSKKEEKPDILADKRFATVWKLIEVVSDNEDDVAENAASKKNQNILEKSSDVSSYELAMKTQRDDADVAESLIKLSGQNDALDSSHLSEWNCSASSVTDIPTCVGTSSSNPASLQDNLAIPMFSLQDRESTSKEMNSASEAVLPECLRQNTSFVEDVLCPNDAGKLPETETVWENRNGNQVSRAGNDENKTELSTTVCKDKLPVLADNCDRLITAAKSNLLESHIGNQVNTCKVQEKDIAESGKVPESVTEAVTGSSESSSKESSVPKRKKVYGKFEYTPTGEHILRCLVSKCSQTFDTKRAAELHNAVHPGLGSAEGETSSGGAALTYFQCFHCDFRAPFYHWYDLLRHMSQKHSIRMSDESAAITCEYCGLGFDGEDKLAVHMEFHYSNRYKCVYCGLLLLTWGQVQRHLENCAEKSKQHRGGGTNLGCPFCTFVFHKKNIRNLHLLSHIDTGLSCALCDDGVVWSDWKSLRKHYQQKHSKVMNDKISPFLHDLPNRQPPLRCTRSGCDVTFKTMALFSSHMFKTHDLVPYTLIECVQCERRFRTEKSHEWHVRHMHGEERLCDKCDFVASSKAMLKLHIVQKHQEKQHTCSECDKSFLYFHQLRIHMAHHARRTIYPCRRCDLEFNRLADLRQHLREEHRQTSAGASTTNDVPTEEATGHDCPECDFHATTRAAVVQHVRKTHPELADGAIEPEDGGHEHSYFTRKMDVQVQPSFSPPEQQPLLSPPVHRPQRTYAKRGRRRRLIVPTVDKDDSNHYLRVAADRRERRVIKQQEKQHEERVKRLRKWTCARTRTYDEHREMGRGNILAQPRVSRPGKDDGTDAGDVFDPLVKALPSYPYIDHPYAREEIDRSADRLQALWNGGYSRTVQKPVFNQLPLNAAVNSSSDVSAFQECETVLLGLGSPTSRGGRGRRGRGGRGRGSFGLDRRVRTGGMPMSEELDQLDPDIRDLDLLAESELLLRPAGDYSIIQDILGPGSGGVSTARKIPVGYQLGQSPLKPANVAGMAPRTVAESLHRAKLAATSATDNGLTDGLPLDEVAATTDLDDIELCEDDYRLFNTTNTIDSEASTVTTLPHLNSNEVSELGNASGGALVGTQWKNREEYAMRIGGSLYHRTSVDGVSSQPIITESVVRKNFGRIPPIIDTSITRASSNLVADSNEQEDLLSDASNDESAGELDTSTDTASPSSPGIDDNGSVESLSDSAKGVDDAADSDDDF